MNCPRPRVSDGRTRIQTCFCEPAVQVLSALYAVFQQRATWNTENARLPGTGGGRVSGTGWGRKGACPGSACFSGTWLPYNVPEASFFPSSTALSHRKFEMDFFVTSRFYVSLSRDPCFPWDPDLLDDLQISVFDKPTVEGSPEKQRLLGGQ